MYQCFILQISIISLSSVSLLGKDMYIRYYAYVDQTTHLRLSKSYKNYGSHFIVKHLIKIKI